MPFLGIMRRCSEIPYYYSMFANDKVVAEIRKNIVSLRTLCLRGEYYFLQS